MRLLSLSLAGLVAALLSPSSPVTLAPSAAAQARSGNLTVYVVDVEGGNATLVVSPSGESLLIDTGSPGSRDADRITAAAKDAGLTRIDHLVTTHYHSDHVGGVVDLGGRIPIRRFYDHGPNVETGDGPERLNAQYAGAYAKGTHTIAKAGDTIPVVGLEVQVVTSAGQAIRRPLAGGTANPLCASFTRQDTDASENAQSVGTAITLGKFRMVHLGDLTWNKEFDLMCPTNPIGTIDLLIVSHHGLNVSNSPVLVHALRPRVAIMNNGIAKGGTPDTMRVIRTSPGLEDLWQLHFPLLGGQEYAAPGVFIANPQPDAVVPVAPAPPVAPGVPAVPGSAHDGPAQWIKVSAQRDGTFTIVNSRNGFSKTYQAR